MPDKEPPQKFRYDADTLAKARKQFDACCIAARNPARCRMVGYNIKSTEEFIQNLYRSAKILGKPIPVDVKERIGKLEERLRSGRLSKRLEKSKQRNIRKK